MIMTMMQRINNKHQDIDFQPSRSFQLRLNTSIPDRPSNTSYVVTASDRPLWLKTFSGGSEFFFAHHVFSPDQRAESHFATRHGLTAARQLAFLANRSRNCAAALSHAFHTARAKGHLFVDGLLPNRRVVFAFGGAMHSVPSGTHAFRLFPRSSYGRCGYQLQTA